MVINNNNKKAQGKERLSFNKKAQGHIEIMISFVLFVGFLLFFFLYMNPFSNAKEKVPIDKIQELIINNMSLKIGILSAIVDTDNDCYSLEDVGEYGSKFVEIQDLDSPRKFTLYYHEMFGTGTISCVSRPERNFKLGVYKEEDMIVYEQIQNLKENYESNYNLLKSLLGTRDDFSFSFKEIDGEEVEELSVSKQTPSGTERQAVEFPVRVINSTGYIQELILNLRGW